MCLCGLLFVVLSCKPSTSPSTPEVQRPPLHARLFSGHSPERERFVMSMAGIRIDMKKDPEGMDGSVFSWTLIGLPVRQSSLTFSVKSGSTRPPGLSSAVRVLWLL